jgi:biotin operon repressor
MKTKEQISKQLGISRKSLYNYINELNIKELTDDNIKIIEDYVKNKNKSKEISKSDLLEQLEKLKKENIELISKNEKLEESQDVLLNQIEWYRNSINNEIREIKENMILLLNPPKEKNKSFLSRLFKK